MTPIIANANQNQSREFRTVTASTKVTEPELRELERAAASRGVRLGEWVRSSGESAKAKRRYTKSPAAITARQTAPRV